MHSCVHPLLKILRHWTNKSKNNVKNSRTNWQTTEKFLESPFEKLMTLNAFVSSQIYICKRRLNRQVYSLDNMSTYSALESLWTNLRYVKIRTTMPMPNPNHSADSMNFNQHSLTHQHSHKISRVIFHVRLFQMPISRNKQICIYHL